MTAHPRFARTLGKRLARTHRVLAQTLPHIADGAADAAIHRCRVAMRRARVVLKFGDDVIGRKQAKALNRDLRWLAGILGDVRSCEIFLANLDDGHATAEVAVARDRLSRERAHAMDVARRASVSERAQDSINALADVARRCLADPGRERATPALARLVRKQLRKCLADMGRIKSMSKPHRLHDLRKDMKALRYLIEMLDNELLAEPWLAALHDEVRRLQDWLGRYQDLSSWIERLDFWIAADDPGQLELEPQWRALRALSADGIAQRRAMGRRFGAERRLFRERVREADVRHNLDALLPDAEI